MYKDYPHSTPMKMVQDHILERAYSRDSAAKTPYQLDLEVKDRTPAIEPKVGDKVKIKSREWYEKWKDARGDVDVPFSFVSSMQWCLGETMEIESAKDGRFFMKDSVFLFSMEMFEEVYPKQEEVEFVLPKIDLKDPLLYQSPYSVEGGGVHKLSPEDKERYFQEIRKKWEVAPIIEDVAKRLTAYTLVKGAEPKSPTKLKMVGRTQAIKLKKL